MRNLATIQKIEEIKEIPGANRISSCKILGWSVVIEKDKYNEGDKVVFCEPDSVLPDKPAFEFLRKDKFRIKTRKFLKFISQGIVFPISILPLRNNPYIIGEDVSDLLGVTKYDPEGDLESEMLAEKERSAKNRVEKYLLSQRWYRKLLRLFTGEKQQGFPKFINKTDETRIQILKDSFCQREKDTNFTATVKLDGQSLTAVLLKNPNKMARFFGEPYIFILCSRNLKLGKHDPNNNYWKMAKKYNLENKLKLLIGKNSWVAIQGECVGNIQGNKYGLKENKLYIFNLIYPSGKVDDKVFRPMLEKIGLSVVPLYNYNFKLGNTVAESVAKVSGLTGGFVEGVIDEGLVIRDYSRDISFKIINPEFLLKHNL